MTSASDGVPVKNDSDTDQTVIQPSQTPALLQRLRSFTSIPSQQTSLQTLILLTLLGWGGGVVLRLLYLFLVKGIQPIFFEGVLLPTTSDTYLWLEEARRLLETPGPREANPLPLIAATLVRYLPFISLNSVMVNFSTFIPPLIAIPLVLIARTVGLTWLGFVASLFATSAWIYYQRTIPGCFDTDSIALVTPLFVLWGIVRGVQLGDRLSHVITFFAVALSVWLYPQNYALMFSISGMLLLYILAFERRSPFLYWHLGFALLGLATISPGLKISLFAGAFILLFLKDRLKFTLTRRGEWLIAAVAVGVVVVIMMTTGGVDPILAKIRQYVFPNTVEGGGDSLKYFRTMASVNEAQVVPFSLYGARVAGHWALTVVGCAGYLVLLLRNRVLLLTLPLLGLGVLGFGIPGLFPGAGLRFAIYAVPVVSLGLALVIFKFSTYVTRPDLRCLTIALLTALALAPNYTDIKPTSLDRWIVDRSEAAVLKDLAKRVKPDHDYVLATWDYGYGIRYYTRGNIVADGGTPFGSWNYAMAFVLSHPDLRAAIRMARLTVEYAQTSSAAPIPRILQDYGFKNANEFLQTLGTEAFVPLKKTREAYLYLPYRFSQIFQGNSRSYHVDLMSGKERPVPLFAELAVIGNTDNTLTLEAGISIDKQNKSIRLRRSTYPVKNFVAIRYGADGRQVTSVDQLNPEGISVIHFVDLRRAWIAEDASYNSPYVQLFALEQYDPKLVELVQNNQLAKVYRLID